MGVGTRDASRLGASSRMTRRTLLGWMGGLAGTGLLVACAPAAPQQAGAASGQPAATTAPANKPATTAPAAAKSGTPVKLTMWGNHPEWKPPLAAMLETFTKSNPSIEIELETKALGEYAGAVSVALAGGAAPDLIGFGPGGFVFDAAKAGQISEVTGKIPVDNLIPAAVNQVTSADGKVWGVPLSLATVLPIYSKAIFQRHNLTPPKTWDEMLEICKKLRAAGVTPIAMGAKEGSAPFFLYTLAVTSILGESGFNDLLQGKVKLTDDNLLPAARLTKELQPYFTNGFETVSNVESKIEFVKGNGAFVFGGTSNLADFKLQDPNFEVDVFGFPPPAVGKGKPSTQYGFELIYTVNSQSKHPAEAATFLGWLASKEAQQIVADNLAQPVAKGVFPSNPVKKAMIDVGETTVPVWRDTPQFRDGVGVMVKDGMGIFSGRIPPEGLAEALQKSMRTNV